VIEIVIEIGVEQTM